MRETINLDVPSTFSVYDSGAVPVAHLVTVWVTHHGEKIEASRLVTRVIVDSRPAWVITTAPSSQCVDFDFSNYVAQGKMVKSWSIHFDKAIEYAKSEAMGQLRDKVKSAVMKDA